VQGRRIEAVELPGDPGRRPLVLLHEGLGSVGLWREFPAALQEATGRRVIAFSRFGHGRSEPPPVPRTPAFFHTEALEVLPALLPQLDAEEPLLVGHSDGASIALIHAGRHPVAGLALLAPHVVVEDLTVEAIRDTRRRYLEDDLRARMTRHHDDVDAAFWGWCDVWLDTRVPQLEPGGGCRAGRRPDAPDPRRRRPIRDARPARPDRRPPARPGRAAGAAGRPQPAPRAALRGRGRHRGVQRQIALNGGPRGRLLRLAQPAAATSGARRCPVACSKA
jgi:pimeloyl-ACP methyl ester carboxylesterase